ncbi:unnamed protein product [Pedinophyceae sp. YPF-701]|nr:unnamed protein product [Pedinophyceae sp. YPF-701]
MEINGSGITWPPSHDRPGPDPVVDTRPNIRPSQMSATAPARASNGAAPPHGFQFQHFPVKFTSSFRFPDSIKLRKRLRIWPIRASLGVDLDLRAQDVRFHLTVKDQVLGGRLTLDRVTQTVEYYKGFTIPQSAMEVHVHGRCSYLPAFDQGAPLRPSLTVGLDFADGIFTMVRNSFDVRKKINLTQNVQLEACGNVRLPLPVAQYAQDGPGRRLALGGQDLRLHMDRLNLIVKV